MCRAACHYAGVTEICFGASLADLHALTGSELAGRSDRSVTHLSMSGGYGATECLDLLRPGRPGGRADGRAVRRHRRAVPAEQALAAAHLGRGAHLSWPGRRCRGLRVLDLACGEGFYSRGAGRARRAVVGVDISPAMIALAREAEERQTPLGIDYRCADVAELPELGQFDLVWPRILLHYARDRAGAACRHGRNIARCLPEGGRFVTLNENPAQPEETEGDYARYGFGKSVARPLEEGASDHLSDAVRPRHVQLRGALVLRADLRARVARRGFSRHRVAGAAARSAGRGGPGRGVLRAYLARPPVLALECRR